MREQARQRVAREEQLEDLRDDAQGDCHAASFARGYCLGCFSGSLLLPLYIALCALLQ